MHPIISKNLNSCPSSHPEWPNSLPYSLYLTREPLKTPIVASTRSLSLSLALNFQLHRLLTVSCLFWNISLVCRLSYYNWFYEAPFTFLLSDGPVKATLVLVIILNFEITLINLNTSQVIVASNIWAGYQHFGVPKENRRNGPGSYLSITVSIAFDS